MSNKFLDNSGVTYLWKKIKSELSSVSGGSGGIDLIYNGSSSFDGDGILNLSLPKSTFDYAILIVCCSNDFNDNYINCIVYNEIGKKSVGSFCSTRDSREWSFEATPKEESDGSYILYLQGIDSSSHIITVNKIYGIRKAVA